jgi:hypothetical protein
MQPIVPPIGGTIGFLMTSIQSALFFSRAACIVIAFSIIGIFSKTVREGYTNPPAICFNPAPGNHLF